jgi:hypothetical protein
MDNRTKNWVESTASEKTLFEENINTRLVIESIKEEHRIKDYEDTINLMKVFLSEAHNSLKKAKRPITVQNCNDTLSNLFYDPNANEFTPQGKEPNRSLSGHWTNEWVKFNDASIDTKLNNYDYMYRIFTSLSKPANNIAEYLDNVVAEVSAVRLSLTN